MHNVVVPTTQKTFRERWPILTAVTLAHVCGAAGAPGIPPLALLIQREFSITRTDFGLAMSVYSFGFLLGVLLGGWLTDSIGVRRVLMLGQSSAGLLVIAAGILPSFPLFVVAIGCVGVSYSLLSPATTKAVLYWFPAQQRATAMGIKQTGVTVGQSLSAAIFPAVAVLSSWHIALIGAGLVIVLSALFSTLVFRETAEESQRTRPGLVATLRSLLAVARNRQIAVLSVLGLLLLSAQTVFLFYLPLFLSQTMLLSIVAAGMCLAAGQISGSGARIVMGVISDRWLQGKRMTGVFFLAALATVLTLVVAFMGPPLPFLVVLVVSAILGLALTGWNALYLTYLAELGGAEQGGRAVGFGLAFGFVGVIVASPIFGYTADVTGSYRLGWILAAGCVAVVTVLLPLTVKESRRAAGPR